jgi:hydrogenase maturation protease
MTEVLLEGQPASSVEVTVRFLQVVSRIAGRRWGQEFEPVDELIHRGERYSTWEEAREREIRVGPLELDQLRAGKLVPITVAQGSEQEALGEEAALMRNWSALKGEVRLGASQLDLATWRVSATITNLTPFAGRTREDAVAQSFCSTHTLLNAHGGTFVSMADPPLRLAEAAAAASNIGSWPVLVGDPARRDQILSSPIILEDFPRVAPESPGDLFDGGEIDQLLILNILAMTDEEQAEMSASDPKAREILERTRALTPEQLMALHGTIREFGLVR